MPKLGALLREHLYESAIINTNRVKPWLQLHNRSKMQHGRIRHPIHKPSGTMVARTLSTPRAMFFEALHLFPALARESLHKVPNFNALLVALVFLRMGGQMDYLASRAWGFSDTP